MLETQAKLIKTKNIQKSLIKYASDNELTLLECDFSIKKVDTYVKESASDEFILISNELLKEYTDKDRILNEHIEFNQVYTIVAKKLKKSSLKLNYEILLGENATHPKNQNLSPWPIFFQKVQLFYYKNLQPYQHPKY